jgi:hypothetical protein
VDWLSGKVVELGPSGVGDVAVPCRAGPCWGLRGEDPNGAWLQLSHRQLEPGRASGVGITAGHGSGMGLVPSVA